MTDSPVAKLCDLAPANPLPVASGSQYRDAYQRVLPAARALLGGELITINIDVPTAVTTVIGKLSRLRSFREVMAALTPFDIANLEQLETYTLATAHAHALYLSASEPAETVLKLQAHATALRDTLYSDAVALANRGLLSGARLGEFKRAVGYKNVAFDLLGLTALLREAWSRIQGNTALKLEELDEADLTGEQLVNAVGARDQHRATGEATQIRQRMFTLFLNAYDQVRRALSFLRWNEDDVDDLAPSLYAGRARRKTDVPAELPEAPPPVRGTTAKTEEAALPPVTPAAVAATNGGKLLTSVGSTGDSEEFAVLDVRVGETPASVRGNTRRWPGCRAE